ncbi:MAG: hypothetical protein M1839_004502 [Geoglossum umbratile]|nr:MAG: hypothetical protein M1839_004502 [Geoglossum umbratile]
MDMNMGAGMDMSSSPMFRTYSQALARGYWYIVAGLVGFILLLRAFEFYEIRSRLRLSQSRSIEYPTKPQNIATQIYATATAISREMSYPNLHLKGPFSWLSPPPLGRALFIICYWAVIIFMMTDKAIISDAQYYERIGFRAAWISVTQVPLVYLLASKSSLIGHLAGSSHERLNQLHRWVSRTLLVTVTVHGGFFMREWVLADLVKMELWMMPIVKYGIGAWAVLVWTFLSSLSPLRRRAYELFVLQHIAAAAVFLWLLWVHVPSYASYNVWFAIGAISFDWILRGALLIYDNFRVRSISSDSNNVRKTGYRAELQTWCEDITVITIRDVRLSWKPGQHLYLWIPRLGPLETHPFTIASPHTTTNECLCDAIQFAVRTESGFSKRIHSYAGKMEREDKVASLTAFIAGPYGAPPNWSAYETLILISASTGASFTLPIVESVLYSSSTMCVRRISFLLIVRQRTHIEFYTQRLLDALARAETTGINLSVEIAITDGRSSDKSSLKLTNSGEVEQQHPDDGATVIEGLENEKPQPQGHVLSKRKSHSSLKSLSEQGYYSGEVKQQKTSDITVDTVDSYRKPRYRIVYSDGRPNISEFIRGPIEATGGETTVAVCGGKSVVATVRNCVASLSDERAVHKGTGANGIHLHVEEYCF